jgi:hypothetical protein
MTARQIVELLGTRPLWLALALALPPLVVLGLGLVRGRERADSPWRYLYSVVVYLVAVPGVLAAVLTAYTLLFTSESLLDVDLLVHVGPVVAMVLTLVLVGRNVRFEHLPGFDRLSGLLATLAVTFVILLALARTRIWLFFGGSLASLALVALGLYAVLAWGVRAAFGRRAPGG